MKTPGRKRVEEILDSPCKFHSLVVPFNFGHSKSKYTQYLYGINFKWIAIQLAFIKYPTQVQFANLPMSYYDRNMLVHCLFDLERTKAIILN